MNDSIGQRFPIGLKALTVTQREKAALLHESELLLYHVMRKHALLEILKPM